MWVVAGNSLPLLTLWYLLDTTIEAPPSVLPHLHLCDITGLEVSSLPVYPTGYHLICLGALYRPYYWPPVSRQKRLRNNQKPCGCFHVISDFQRFNIFQQSTSIAKDYLSGNFQSWVHFTFYSFRFSSRGQLDCKVKLKTLYSIGPYHPINTNWSWSLLIGYLS